MYASVHPSLGFVSNTHVCADVRARKKTTSELLMLISIFNLTKKSFDVTPCVQASKAGQRSLKDKPQQEPWLLIAIEQVSIGKTNCVVQWINIYPVDSVIQLLIN